MATKELIIEVYIKNIIVDNRYQRMLDEKHVREILSNWNPKACQPITLARRLWSKDNAYAVMDGQHRIEVKKRLGEAYIRAEIIDVKNLGEEAALFATYNGKRKVTQHREIFNALTTAGEIQNETITEIVKKNGFRIASSNGNWAITATRSLQNSYVRFGGEILNSTLEMIAKIWKGDSRSTRHQIIEGMALFIAAGDKEIDRKKMIKKLEMITPDMIVRKSKLMNIRDSSTATDVAKVLGSHYNHKMTYSRIDFETLIEELVKKSRMSSPGNPANLKQYQTPSGAKKLLQTTQIIPLKEKQTILQQKTSNITPLIKMSTKPGFESCDEAGWKTAIRIKDAMEECASKDMNLLDLSRHIYKMEGIVFPESNQNRQRYMEERIKKIVISQGEHMDLHIDGDHVLIK